MSYNNISMNADVDVVRLQAKDSALIDHFIKVGEFRSKSEFITYAVKKAVNEVILRELEEKSRAALPMAEKDVYKLLTEIQDIRKKLWEGYAHRVF